MDISGFQARIRSYLPLLVPVFFGLILNFPRVPHIQGYDGYTLIIEAHEFMNGYSSYWLISPLSYFGMMPFSGYPMGSILLLSLFLATGVSLDAAVAAYSLFLSILSCATSYLLLRHLFDDEPTRVLGCLMYQFLPTFYLFNYNMATSRAAVLAMVPLLILYLLKWNRTEKPKYLAYAILLVPILMLFHRMALSYVLFVVVVVLFKVVRRPFLSNLIPFKSPQHSGRAACLLYLFAAAGLFLSSVAILGFAPKNALPAGFLPFLSSVLARDVIGFCIDYALFFGPALLLAVLGTGVMLHEIWVSDSSAMHNSDGFVLLLIALPFAFLLVLPAYVRHLLAPLIVCLAVYGIQLPRRFVTRFPVMAILTLPFAAYFFFYDILVRSIGIYVLAAPTIIGVFVFGMFVHYQHRLPIDIRISRQNQQRIRLVLVLSLVLVVTITNNDMRATVEMDGVFIPAYTTEQEVLIANFIMERNDLFPGLTVILASHYLPEVRIAAYADVGCLSDSHGTCVLISGYVTADEVLTGSTFGSFYSLLEQQILQYNVKPYQLWFDIMTSDYNDPETRSMLNALNIRFFIGLKGSDNALYSFGPMFESEFRKTISAPVVFETENYTVCELY